MWVTALLDHLLQGMRSPVTFVPLYWQSPHSLWNNHLSTEDDNHPPQSSNPARHNRSCSVTQLKLTQGFLGWDTGPNSPAPQHPGNTSQAFLPFNGRAGFREQGLKKTALMTQQQFQKSCSKNTHQTHKSLRLQLKTDNHSMRTHQKV